MADKHLSDPLEFLYRELPPEAMAAAERHMKKCAACRTALGKAREVLKSYRAAPRPKAPAGLAARAASAALRRAREERAASPSAALAGMAPGRPLSPEEEQACRQAVRSVMEEEFGRLRDEVVGEVPSGWRTWLFHPGWAIAASVFFIFSILIVHSPRMAGKYAEPFPIGPAVDHDSGIRRARLARRSAPRAVEDGVASVHDLSDDAAPASVAAPVSAPGFSGAETADHDDIVFIDIEPPMDRDADHAAVFGAEATPLGGTGSFAGSSGASSGSPDGREAISSLRPPPSGAEPFSGVTTLDDSGQHGGGVVAGKNAPAAERQAMAPTPPPIAKPLQSPSEQDRGAEADIAMPLRRREAMEAPSAPASAAPPMPSPVPSPRSHAMPPAPEPPLAGATLPAPLEADALSSLRADPDLPSPATASADAGYGVSSELAAIPEEPSLSSVPRSPAILPVADAASAAMAGDALQGNGGVPGALPPPAGGAGFDSSPGLAVIPPPPTQSAARPSSVAPLAPGASSAPAEDLALADSLDVHDQTPLPPTGDGSSFPSSSDSGAGISGVEGVSNERVRKQEGEAAPPPDPLPPELLARRQVEPGDAGVIVEWQALVEPPQIVERPTPVNVPERIQSLIALASMAMASGDFSEAWEAVDLLRRYDAEAAEKLAGVLRSMEATAALSGPESGDEVEALSEAFVESPDADMLDGATSVMDAAEDAPFEEAVGTAVGSGPVEALPAASGVEGEEDVEPSVSMTIMPEASEGTVLPGEAPVETGTDVLPEGGGKSVGLDPGESSIAVPAPSREERGPAAPAARMADRFPIPATGRGKAAATGSKGTKKPFSTDPYIRGD